MSKNPKIDKDAFSMPKAQDVRKDFNKPTVYSDSTFIRITPYGVVLDFAQNVGPSQHNVVASVGMSRSHAMAIYKLLKKNLKIEEDQSEKKEEKEKGDDKKE